MPGRRQFEKDLQAPWTRRQAPIFPISPSPFCHLHTNPTAYESDSEGRGFAFFAVVRAQIVKSGPSFINTTAAESYGKPCRVRASVVCKYWKQIEASNPLQLDQLCWSSLWLNLPDRNTHYLSLRWHLRDTRSLNTLCLYDKAVPLFLEMRLKLPQLQVLLLSNWGYTYEEANLLGELRLLPRLKVYHR